MGYVTPTPIQQQAIGPVLKGGDLLGIAQTGTGKTAAFALPVLHRLNADFRKAEPRCPRALVLVPTRELALQVQKSFSDYGKHLSLRNTVIFGGVGDSPQKKALQRGVDVLVATPGRLLDLQSQGAIHLRKLEIFVLDEADRMLDMGFIHDIRKVVALLPPRRQNLFFSATMPPDIAALASTILRDPVRVEVTPQSTPVERIDQRLYFAEKKQKPMLLCALVEQLGATRALVFTRTKHGANRVCEKLQKAGISAAAIHGNKSQTRRVEAMEGFRSGTVRVLVATDIAARGIDVEGISHVFNYDLPDVPETYVHRIGRTARAGAEGIAVSFCSSEERAELRDIERLIRMKIPAGPALPPELAERMRAEAAPEAEPERPDRPEREQPRAGGRRGRWRGRNPAPGARRPDSNAPRPNQARPDRNAPRPAARGERPGQGAPRPQAPGPGGRPASGGWGRRPHR